MIDLHPFCSTEPSQPYFHEPFSQGEWTIATDGHIIVRVARRNYPENQVGAAKKFEAFVPPDRPLPLLDFPKASSTDCTKCDGRGFVHDCPDCCCECAACDGAGKEYPLMSVDLYGVPFNVKYIRLLQPLPNVRIAEPVANKPLSFSFDGGVGLLMPLSGPHVMHIQSANAAHYNPRVSFPSDVIPASARAGSEASHKPSYTDPARSNSTTGG